MKYLLIEDNAELAGALCTRMRLDGHVIDHACTLSEGSDFLSVGEYDLILLDIMLPDGDGRAFLERHRAQAGDTPVIVLTARSEVSDRVSMLDLGADDYLTKPFDHAELQARCRAVLRRRTGSAQTVIRRGDAALDPVASVLRIGEAEVTLRNRELRLLELFMNAPGQIFSKDKLVDRLFSYDGTVTENAIEVYVGRLRKHLEPSSLTISTHRGLGYRLDEG
ncbi:response regulator transcription factor [Tateyamaria sp. ANG-S1]|uniref:response regulator transcription factor n=1 Tax=Tateyamaria sp. ANG-S1 TaxID=1577905 RepID=UPI00057F93F2|nr:response regulator transcription factor [Tateyamaria sp. ANG-S1]KIC49870.1 chemotaxis protein CheY [Tateyamaria sp. ANG-S1]